MRATGMNVGRRTVVLAVLCGLLSGVGMLRPSALHAQHPVAVALNWGADDSSRVAFLAANGYRLERAHIVLSAPRDSIDEGWMRALADTLDRGVAGMQRLMKAPYPWQRLGTRPVTYYFSAGRFISHGTGSGAVFIPVSRVRERLAPLLHEAAHELLAPRPPFYYREFADTNVGARVADHTPLWLFEGLPDYLANTVAPAIGLHEGDVFDVGGLARSDSSCAARVKASPRGGEVIEAVGRSVRPELLFTTRRQEIAPIFYSCGQALTRHVVEQLGVRETVQLMPAMARGDWAAQLERIGGIPIEVFRRRWLEQIGLATADSSADTKAWRQIIDDFQRAFTTRDAALFTRHFARDGDFMQAFGRYRATRTATQDFMEWFLGGQTTTFVSRELATRMRRVSPEVAFVETEFEGEGIKNGDGTMQPPRRGQMMLVLRQRASQWQVVSYRYLDIHTATLR